MKRQIEAMQREPEWYRHIGDWLPVLIVIIIGVLSGLRRLFQVMRDRPGREPTPREKPREHPVMEEVRKYLDAYEGREEAEDKQEGQEAPPVVLAPRKTLTKPAAAMPPPSAPPRPRVTSRPSAPPRRRQRPVPSARPVAPSPRVSPVFRRLVPLEAEGQRVLKKAESTPFPAAAEPQTRDAPRRKRALLRQAIVWNEILGPPTALRERLSGDRLT